MCEGGREGKERWEGGSRALKDLTAPLAPLLDSLVWSPAAVSAALAITPLFAPPRVMVPVVSSSCCLNLLSF